MRNLLILISIFLASPVWAVTVNLTIKESAGIARSGEYVSRGVPLALSDNVTSTSTMGVFSDSGLANELAAQFHVLSRWNGIPTDGTKPIRVVLVTFAATCGANSSATYYMNTAAGSGNATGANLASDESGYHQIATGALTARIKETAGFNFFDRVTVDGTNVVNSPTTDGIILRDAYNDTTYASYLSNNAPTVSIVENGPLKCVIAVTGNLEDSSNNPMYPRGSGYVGDSEILYTVYFTAFKNQRIVHATVTIKNENHAWSSPTFAHVHNLWLDYGYVRTTMANLGTPTAVRFGPGEDDGAAFSTTSPSGVYRVFQDHPLPSNDTTEDEWAVMSYKVGASGSETNNTADRFDSYAQMRDANRGLMVFSRWFWQRWWKEIRFDVSNKRVDFYLYPDMTADQQPILGGSWRTNTLAYFFHGNVASNYDFTAEMAAVKHPLGVFPSNWFTSRFLEFIPPDLENFDPGVTWTTSGTTEVLRSAIYKWNQESLAPFDSSVSNSGTDNKDFNYYRRYRNFTWDGGVYSGNRMQWTGDFYYGALPRWYVSSYGYSSQHYDWSALAAIAAMRFQRPDVLEEAEVMSLFHSDVLIMHNPQGSPTTQVTTHSGFTEYVQHGAQRYEAQPLLHNNNFESNGSSWNDPMYWAHQWASQAWVYLITGDPHYKEALDDIGENIKFAYSDITVNGNHRGTYDTGSVCYDPDGSVTSCLSTGESRDYTRGIEGSVFLYEITGDPDFLNIAFAIFEKAMLTQEVGSFGILEYGTTRDWCCSRACDAHGLYESIKVRPMIQLWIALTDAGRTSDAAELDAFITRAATWMRDDNYGNWATACGSYVGSTYYPYTTKLDWEENCLYTGTGDMDGSYSFTWADLFMFMYDRTETESWRDLARKVFFDYLMYGSTPGPRTPNGDLYTEVTIEAKRNTSGNAWLKDGKVRYKPSYFLAREAGITLDAGSLPDPEPDPSLGAGTGWECLGCSVLY